MKAVDTDVRPDDLAHPDPAAFEELEAEVARLLAVWRVKNLRATKTIWHDDQHIGDKRREVGSVKHPSVDLDARQAMRTKPVVDSLEGNSLIHPLDTPVIE